MISGGPERSRDSAVLIHPVALVGATFFDDVVNFGMDRGFCAASGKATGFYGAQYHEQVLGKTR